MPFPGRPFEDSFRGENTQLDVCRYLMDSTSDGIAVVQDGRFQFVNPRFREIFGFSEPDLYGVPFEAAVPSADLEGLMDLHYRRMRGEDVPLQTEAELRRKDGTRIIVEIVARSILYYRRPAALLIFKDISSRKRAEAESVRILEKLRQAMGAAVQAIALTVETRDPTTAGHQRRVSDLALTIAARLGLPSDHMEALRMASSIHDLGKISIPSEILCKPGRLDEAELTLVRTHAKVGYDILSRIDFPWPIAEIVLQHHERMDGSGYPYGLKGPQISIEARVLGVADVVEAMVSHRPYRSALTEAEAIAEILKHRGRLYDPDVVDACARLFATREYQFSR